MRRSFLHAIFVFSSTRSVNCYEWAVVGYFEGGDIPLLGKGGVAAQQANVPVPLKARTGWFGQLPMNRWLERTTLPCFALSGSHSLRSCPSARAKVASRNFLGRAATPPLLRRGICPHEIIVNWTPNSKVVHYPHLLDGCALSRLHLLDGLALS